LNSL